MEVWIVTLIANFSDGEQERRIKGCYSSYKKAKKAIKEYDRKNLNGIIFGNVVRELPCFDGSLGFEREFRMDGRIDNIKLQVNKIPMIMDKPMI